MVIVSCPAAGWARYVPNSRSRQGKLKPKLLFGRARQHRVVHEDRAAQQGLGQGGNATQSA
jgi:hypothetical protein